MIAYYDITYIATCRGMTIERVSELLSGIKAIQVESPLKIVYCNSSPEASSLLNKMNIDLHVRILSGALPKVSQNA